MNRVLGWLVTPSERGQSARLAIAAIGQLVGFAQLAHDVRSGSSIEVLCEATPDPAITNRQPDLLIRTPESALLIENKVWSPESGPDQYSHYLEVLREWAGRREYRAVLLAPTVRSTPDGWHASITHSQLAEALRPLVAESALPFWDRVIFGLVVSDLSPDEMPDRLPEIARLLSSDTAANDVEVATRVSSLLRYPVIDPTNGAYTDVG